MALEVVLMAEESSYATQDTGPARIREKETPQEQEPETGTGGTGTG